LTVDLIYSISWSTTPSAYSWYIIFSFSLDFFVVVLSMYAELRNQIIHAGFFFTRSTLSDFFDRTDILETLPHDIALLAIEAVLSEFI